MGNSCSVHVYSGKGKAQMLCKYCFNILKNFLYEEF